MKSDKIYTSRSIDNPAEKFYNKYSREIQRVGRFHVMNLDTNKEYKFYIQKQMGGDCEPGQYSTTDKCISEPQLTSFDINKKIQVSPLLKDNIIETETPFVNNLNNNRSSSNGLLTDSSFKITEEPRDDGSSVKITETSLLNNNKTQKLQNKINDNMMDKIDDTIESINEDINSVGKQTLSQIAINKLDNQLDSNIEHTDLASDPSITTDQKEINNIKKDIIAKQIIKDIIDNESVTDTTPISESLSSLEDSTTAKNIVADKIVKNIINSDISDSINSELNETSNAQSVDLRTQLLDSQISPLSDSIQQSIAEEQLKQSLISPTPLESKNVSDFIVTPENYNLTESTKTTSYANPLSTPESIMLTSSQPSNSLTNGYTEISASPSNSLISPQFPIQRPIETIEQQRYNHYDHHIPTSVGNNSIVNSTVTQYVSPRGPHRYQNMAVIVEKPKHYDETIIINRRDIFDDVDVFDEESKKLYVQMYENSNADTCVII